MVNFFGCQPAFRVTVDLYRQSIQDIFQDLRTKGVRIEILKEIDLERIDQPSHRSTQILQPAVLYKQRNGVAKHLSGTDIIHMFELKKLETDIYGLLHLTYDLLSNESGESFRFISPLKLYITPEEKTPKKTTFVWIFYLVRRINNQIFVYINGMPDKQYPIPIFPDDSDNWKVVGFSHSYRLPVIKNNSFIKEL